MIKKSLAIILAFFIVFSPVYSYAVLPALAAAVGSAGGRVLVGNVIHNLKRAALSKAGMAWIATGVAAGAGVKSAIETDGWTIEYGAGGGGAGGSWDAPGGVGVDSDGNIDVSIYKLPPNEACEVQVGLSLTDPPTQVNASYSSILPSLAALFFPNKQYRASNNTQPLYDKMASTKSYYQNNTSSLSPEWKTAYLRVAAPVSIYSPEASKWSDANAYVNIVYRCAPYPSNKIYITENEFNAYLTNNITNNQAGDIIKNIYNYDYSQHPTVTTNNNTTGGTDINNDLSISADPELNVTPRLRLDLENNRVNLDNVNDTNCTKTPEGAYDNCTGEPDPEDEEETDPDDPNNPIPEDPPPIECTANGFYQKICDWMDWTKENPTPSEEAPVDIKNIEAESTNKIDMAGECPAPYELNFTIAGYAQNNSISYEPLCGALEMLKPIFIGSGALSGMFILMGYSRPSGTGAN